jgi:hypothetical protein
VKSHPDPRISTVWPGVAQNVPLCRDRRQQRFARAREGGKDRIPLRVDLVTPSFLHGRADESPALHQDLRVGVSHLLEEPCRTLDIREKKRHRPPLVGSPCAVSAMR